MKEFHETLKFRSDLNNQVILVCQMDELQQNVGYSNSNLIGQRLEGSTFECNLIFTLKKNSQFAQPHFSTNMRMLFCATKRSRMRCKMIKIKEPCRRLVIRSEEKRNLINVLSK